MTDPSAFMPRDNQGRFEETHNDGTPCCGVEFKSMTMPSGCIKQSCPNCGNWVIIA